ncbi:LysR substrate-binding domain-containing protein [Rodentibacter sp. Ppn85]|uniref:LysR substrate-binding domain-containing protein n=1 Tax=Rodentibacter sp. Ppn85 TaxID=1908525 RepID=UPI0009870100|nr:LysR substrate-binding domain-containing protein [Rodentibacter sp. Ppn85]
MKHNLDLNDLYLFVQVVNAGSFSEASRRLCIPKTTISRRIAKLEKVLGVALIQRNTHQFEVTHLGDQYYQYCLSLVRQVEKEQRFIDQQFESKGQIRLSCPKELLDLYVNDMLAEFIATYSDIELFVESTNRKVDLIKERLDFALRVRPYPFEDSEVVTKTLCLSQHYLVASPKLIREPFKTLKQIHHYPVLTWARQDHSWSFEHHKEGKQHISYYPKLISENIYLIHKSTVKGVGIAVLPEVLVRKDLKQDRLRIISPEGWHIPNMDGTTLHIVQETVYNRPQGY